MAGDAVGRHEREAASRRDGDGRDVDPLTHGGGDRIGVALHERHELVAPHEPVRIGSVIGRAGELHGPVRGDDAEAVPAVAPCLRDPSALEDEVLDAALGELVAGRKPRLARADDDDINRFHDPRSLPPCRMLAIDPDRSVP
jgi:hypothetical protein